MNGFLRPRVGYVVRASSVMVRHPVSGVERARGRIDRRHDSVALRQACASTGDPYPVASGWLRKLHEALRAPWPCAANGEFESVWADVVARLEAKGIQIGQTPYGGWRDGTSSLALAAWCLALHLRPSQVVETGVARGVTTRFILEAMRRNGRGRLWSIDLPAVDSKFHDEIAAAVPGDGRDEWTYLEGTSRRRLPPLLAELGEIDLFVHDSLHTGRNTRFELEHAWRVLRPGGAVLVDDVYQSLAFSQFVERARPRWTTIGALPDGGYRFGIALKEDDLPAALHGQIPRAVVSTSSAA